MDDPLPAAPEIPDHLTWFNTGEPLYLQGVLWGQVVVLAFWNSSDIHSCHLLETLAALHVRYTGRALAVVGVHTAKFPAQRDDEHVRTALGRLAVRHPVVVDRDNVLWRSYGCRAWPTLVVIDAEGRIRFRGAGEVDRRRLVAAADALLDEAAERGASAGTPHVTIGDSRPRPEHGLCWPTRLATDPRRGWLWIADTGHHRVLAVDLETGAVRMTAGSGAPGGHDGPLAEASFYRPSGLAVGADKVYVADSGNHTVRSIDVAAGVVDTELGCHRRVVDRAGGGAGLDQGLCGPLDLALRGQQLYIALAGGHQLWRFDCQSREASALAGTGSPTRVDGPVSVACFAQPAGLAVRGHTLACVDTQASALRLVDLRADYVATAAGTGGLFDFGDSDGPLLIARLQAPTAVAAAGDDDWLVADTLNHSLRVVRPRAGRVETLATGLLEPGGVAVVGDTVFVADTGAHRLLRGVLDGGALEPWPLPDLPPGGRRLTKAIELRAYADATLRARWPLPSGARRLGDVPPVFEAENVEGCPLLADQRVVAAQEGDDVVASDVPMGEPGEGTFAARFARVTCRDPEGVWHVDELAGEIRAELVQEGASTAEL